MTQDPETVENELQSDDGHGNENENQNTEELPFSENILPEGKSVWECDWSVWYEKCTHFTDAWKEIHRKDEWPRDYALTPDGKYLFYQGKKCLPTALVPYVEREHHEETGHAGRQKLMTDLQRFYCMRQEKTTLVYLVFKCEVLQQNHNT